MNTCIYGRAGEVPGPLCNVLQGRDPVDPMHDPVYVIAAGRANHAGTGGWRGLVGNSSVHGLEVEHPGTGAVPRDRLEVSARIHAAFLEAPGSSRDARYTCQHKEWAPARKIDFFNLVPFTNDSFRDRVAYWIGRSANSLPPIPPDEEDDMKPHKLRLVDSNPDTWAYLIPDGTVIDKDWQDRPLTDTTVADFVAVYESTQALRVQVDRVQTSIRRARGDAW